HQRAVKIGLHVEMLRDALDLVIVLAAQKGAGRPHGLTTRREEAHHVPVLTSINGSSTSSKYGITAAELSCKPTPTIMPSTTEAIESLVSGASFSSRPSRCTQSWYCPRSKSHKAVWQPTLVKSLNFSP
nr:hypothetical protein [Tanacetum cinerariifolium]